MTLCTKACELPYYLSEYYVSRSPPEFAPAQRWLHHASVLSDAVPSHMESRVTAQLIPELQRAIKAVRIG
jgi:hypothetical protein